MLNNGSDGTQLSASDLQAYWPTDPYTYRPTDIRTHILTYLQTCRSAYNGSGYYVTEQKISKITRQKQPRRIPNMKQISISLCFSIREKKIDRQKYFLASFEPRLCSTVASPPASKEQHRGVTWWLARSLRELEVVGSIPVGPISFFYKNWPF